MSDDDKYHVTLADGLQSDVVQVRSICCPAINVMNIGFKVTDTTGTV